MGRCGETLSPQVRTIYGATKIAAEDLCELIHKLTGLPVIVLRTSRFFPEDDDDPAALAARSQSNIQANEHLYRRVDIEDVVSARWQALYGRHGWTVPNAVDRVL